MRYPAVARVGEHPDFDFTVATMNCGHLIAITDRERLSTVFFAKLLQCGNCQKERDV